ncbi:MAG TPA: NTP transferase domain-containing protein [Firmicutes bacterium]|nr:NTP transferase domain-containing protein [Bacillota bacterium]
MKVDAVVLAGALNDGKLAEASPEKWEAVIPIHGKPMVNYVIEVLQALPRVENLVVVGPAEIEKHLPPGTRLVECGKSLVENVFLGVEALAGENKVLLVSSDIPFIHTEAMDDFLDRCSELERDIYYPLVSKESNEQVYPETVRTYFKLKEGTFTGGNILLAAPQAIAGSREIMTQVIFQRKKPWKIIGILGCMFLIKLLMSRLSLSEIEKRAQEILGYSGALMITPYPEIGTDVDKPADLELAQKMISPNHSKEA